MNKIGKLNFKCYYFKMSCCVGEMLELRVWSQGYGIHIIGKRDYKTICAYLGSNQGPSVC